MVDHGGGPVRWRPTWPLAVILVMALTACAGNLSTGELQGVPVESPQPKPQFTLTDTSGQPYDFASETEGKLTLLYFGYLNCPDICPVHLAQVAETFDRLPDVARESVMVFVSVDPDRDTPADIRDFLDRFDTRFVGLTGTSAELEAAQVAAGVPVARYTPQDDGYSVEHAAWVIAYAPDGVNRTIYPSGTRQTEWSNDLRILAGMTG